MKIRIAFATMLGLTAASPAFAQPSNLDRDCPIPYTVARQQTVTEAYARVTANIATALPLGNLNNPTITAFHSNVRSLIAGEALQALADVRAAYVCRLRATLPQNKHRHVDLIVAEAARITQASFLQDNFASFSSVNTLIDELDARAAQPLPGWAAIPVADRVTPADILAAVGSPDFRSRNESRTGIEAAIGPVEVGGCRAVVRATLAAIDNATIGALAAHHTVLADLAAESTRSAAYQRIALDAQSIFQPGATAQIATQVSQNANRPQIQSCMRQAAQTVIVQNVEQNVQQNVPPTDRR